MRRKRLSPGSNPPGWTWIGFAVLLAMCVPWYFPAGGAVEPRVWAFPFWGAVVTGFSVLLSIFTALVCLYGWKDGEPRGGYGSRRRRRSR